MPSLRERWRKERADAKEASKEIWHWARYDVQYKNLAKRACNLKKPKVWAYWIATLAAIAAIVLLSHYRDTAVEAFEPHKDSIVNAPVSWLAPIGILIVLSFPPLGGHEVVLLVVGLIWGLWVGFGIASAGTFIGELLCYLVFRFYATNKAREVEEKSLYYACLARLMRECGLGMLIIIRFSAIPGHVVTAIQSTVGISWWVYSLAVIATLPKQLVFVYLGVEFGTTASSTDPSTNTRQKRVSLAVFFATCLASVLALYLIYMRARKLWPLVVAEKAQRDHLKFLEDREDGRVDAPLTKQQVGDVVVVDGPAAAIGVGQDGHRREGSFETEASEESARREYEREKQRRGDIGRGNYTGTPTEEKTFYPPTTYDRPYPQQQHPYAFNPGSGAPMAGVGANGNGRHNFPTSPSAASLQLQQRAAMDSHASDLGGTTLVDRSRENRTPVDLRGREGAQPGYGYQYGNNPYGQGEGIPSGSFAEIPLTSPAGQRGGGRAY